MPGQVGQSGTGGASGGAIAGAGSQAGIGASSIGKQTSTLSGQSLLTKPNEQGNRAAAVQPEQIKNGTHKGKRDAEIKQLRERLSTLRAEAAKKGVSRERLQQLQKEISFTKNRLTKNIAIDWLANTAYAAGARRDVVQQLDSAKVRVVDNKSLQSDAAYSERGNQILVKWSAVRSIIHDIRALDKRGIVDFETGKIIDAKALKRHQATRNLVVQQGLMLHEAQHAHQDHNGHAHGHNEKISNLIAQLGGITDPQQRQVAEQHIVREYIRDVELSAYRQQERYQFEMGIAPRQSKWMTIAGDAKSGKPVNVATERAIDNILGFFAESGKPLTVSDVARFVGAADPGYGKPGYGKPGYGKPGYGKPAEAVEGYGKPGYGKPGYGKPGYGKPGEVIEGYGKPGYGKPGQVVQGYGKPGEAKT